VQAQGEEGAAWGPPSQGSFEEEDSHARGGPNKGRPHPAPEDRDREREREKEEDSSRVGLVFLDAKDGQRGLAQWGMAKLQKRMDQLL